MRFCNAEYLKNTQLCCGHLLQFRVAPRRKDILWCNKCQRTSVVVSVTRSGDTVIPLAVR